MEHQFSGMIKCQNCNKNFKKKFERKKACYICSGFSNYGKEFCPRFQLEETDLLDTVTKHLAIRGIQIEDSMDKYVHLINVKGRGYTVDYTDGSMSIINNYEEEYGVKVKY